MSFGNIHHEIDDLLNEPLQNASEPMRWQRKRNEAKTPKSARGKTPKKSPHGDRFIPNRSAMNMGVAQFNLARKENDGGDSNVQEGEENSGYKATLAENLLDGKDKAKVLAFKNKAPAPSVGYQNNLKVLYSQNKGASDTTSKKVTRHISQAPSRILDAPDLLDDYYLNLLDWSANNILAVALGQTVYLWNATSSEITQLVETEEEDNYITSLNWTAEGNFLAVGTNNAEVQIYDVENSKKIRSMKGHQSRVGSLAWNNHVLSSGSRDSMIFHHDVRIAQHHFATLEGHEQEVCGLKWSADGKQLASGGNDNILNIWDEGQTSARFTLDHHMAAVKALAWCPWQSNLLASGGGTADRMIRFWNTSTGTCLNSIDTKSQVCALQWSKHEKEIVSSHGYSQNQLCVWKYPSMAKIAELTGHTSRVLHMAMSPDGETVVSAAGDESLRFWKIFNAPEKKAAKKAANVRGSMSMRMNIR